MAKRFYLPEKVCKMCNIDKDVDLVVQNIDPEKELVTLKIMRDTKQKEDENGGITITTDNEKARSDRGKDWLY